MAKTSAWNAAYMAGLLTSIAVLPVWAQETGQGDTLALEEIVVTARRSAERLQDAPVAVTALSADALDRLGASDLGDLQAAVPNLTLHEGDASNAVVYIRGVGQIDSLAFADPGVGIYLDDVYLGRAQGAFLDVFDTERVEVLRGPQGTLYGRNTIGGAVKFVSKQPDDRTAASLEATLGDYNRRDVKASVRGPLIPEKLAGSAAIAYLSRDGYAKNSVGGKDDGDQETFAWRLGLKATPNDRLTLSLSADGSDDRPDTSRTPARATAVFGTPPNADPFKVDADFNGLNKLSVRGVAAHIGWDASDAVSLKSITAYRTMDYKTHLDLDATGAAIFGVFVDEAQKQFSQEFQANVKSDRFDGVFGLYYFREHDETESGLAGPVISLVTNSLNDQTNRSYAAYGQGSYHVTDALSLTAGLRYTYEKKSFDRIQEFFAATSPVPPPLGTGLRITDVKTGDNWSSLSPKLGLDYKVSDDVMAYASAARGFKSGGFDGRSNNPAQAVAYDPETMWSYEVGLKSSLLDRRITLNLAGFYNDYKDLQLSSFVADSTGGFAALFTNAGAATTKGLELEMTARATQDLTLSATAAWLDAQYDEYKGPGGADIAHLRTPVNSPEWSFRMGANWQREVGDAGRVIVDGDLSYRSKTYPTVSSSEVLAQSGYALLNAQIAFQTADEHWTGTFGVRNITDKRYVSHGFDLSDSLGYQLAYYGAPRTWSLGLKYRY